MGLIEDIRKLIQDLVTPDLKAIRVELATNHEVAKMQTEALDLKLSGQIAAVDAKLSAEIATVDSKLSAEIAAVDSKLSAEIAAVDTKLSGQIAAVDAKLSAEIAAVDSKLSTQITAVDSKLSAQITSADAKIAGVDQKFTAKFDLILARMDMQHATVMNGLELNKRVADLERQMKSAEPVPA